MTKKELNELLALVDNMSERQALQTIVRLLVVLLQKGRK
jgi:hypothetical protein